MSLRYKGGIKSATGAVPTAGTGSWSATTVGTWGMQEATQLKATGYWQTGLTVPGAPTIGTATGTSATTATVAFTAPANTGGSAITTYTATSSAGSFTGTSASSPITVTGAFVLNTAYTFTVTATNAIGVSAASSASNSVTPNATVSAVEYLVVAGGGSGFYSTGNGGVGGGGAGGFRTATGLAVSYGVTYTVLIQYLVLLPLQEEAGGQTG